MIDEKLKQEADELARTANDMAIPMLLIGPILNTTDDEWKRIAYSFLSLKSALEEKMKLPIQIAMVDCNTDINVEVLDSMGVHPDELDMREFFENGIE